MHNYFRTLNGFANLRGSKPYPEHFWVNRFNISRLDWFCPFVYLIFCLLHCHWNCMYIIFILKPLMSGLRNLKELIEGLQDIGVCYMNMDWMLMLDLKLEVALLLDSIRLSVSTVMQGIGRKMNSQCLVFSLFRTSNEFRNWEKRKIFVLLNFV